jgi:hypothetical protein
MRTLTLRFDPGQLPTPADDVAVQWFASYVDAIRRGRFSEAIMPKRMLAAEGFDVRFQRPGPRPGDGQEGPR